MNKNNSVFNVTIEKRGEYYNPVCMATIPESFVATCESVAFDGNTSLSWIEYPIYGNTRKEAIENMKNALIERGLHGTMHIINVI